MYIIQFQNIFLIINFFNLITNYNKKNDFLNIYFINNKLGKE